MPMPLAESNSSERAFRLTILLVLLYLVLPAQALLPIDDPDIWWRFRVGEWIVQHHAVPFVDYYSAYDAGKPWIEYSWLFALLMYWLHAHFGLVGIAYFIVAMAMAISAVVYQLIRRSGLPAFAEVAFAGFALASMKSLMTPRPWLITILLFAIELLVIDRSRRLARYRILWWLPPLFVIWANFHIQFIYGLAVIFALALEAVAIPMFKKLGWSIDGSLSPRGVVFIAAACAAATLITPYHVLLYRQILDYIGGQTGIFQNIVELHPMFFRSPGDWLVLFLALSAAFALGWRRKWVLYPTLIFIMAAFWAFRARRDVWALVLVSVWVVGETARAFCSVRERELTWRWIASAAVAVIGILFGLGTLRQITETQLQAVVKSVYPVEAVDYVRRHRLPGPLFNDYDWGGFLLWSLPELPVVMDGRVNLYGDEKFERSLNTWSGGKGWETDPDLLRAKLIIAKSDRQLTNLLRASPKYRVAYEDKVAVVFAAAN